MLARKPRAVVAGCAVALLLLAMPCSASLLYVPAASGASQSDVRYAVAAAILLPPSRVFMAQNATAALPYFFFAVLDGAGNVSVPHHTALAGQRLRLIGTSTYLAVRDFGTTLPAGIAPPPESPLWRDRAVALAVTLGVALLLAAFLAALWRSERAKRLDTPEAQQFHALHSQHTADPHTHNEHQSSTDPFGHGGQRSPTPDPFLEPPVAVTPPADVQLDSLLAQLQVPPDVCAQVKERGFVSVDDFACDDARARLRDVDCNADDRRSLDQLMAYAAAQY